MDNFNGTINLSCGLLTLKILFTGKEEMVFTYKAKNLLLVQSKSYQTIPRIIICPDLIITEEEYFYTQEDLIVIIH